MQLSLTVFLFALVVAVSAEEPKPEEEPVAEVKKTKQCCYLPPCSNPCQQQPATQPPTLPPTLPTMPPVTQPPISPDRVPYPYPNIFVYGPGGQSSQFGGSNIPQFGGSNIPQFGGSNIPQFPQSNIKQFGGSNIPQLPQSNIPSFPQSNIPSFPQSNFPAVNPSQIGQQILPNAVNPSQYIPAGAGTYNYPGSGSQYNPIGGQQFATQQYPQSNPINYNPTQIGQQVIGPQANAPTQTWGGPIAQSNQQPNVPNYWPNYLHPYYQAFSYPSTK